MSELLAKAKVIACLKARVMELHWEKRRKEEERTGYPHLCACVGCKHKINCACICVECKVNSYAYWAKYLRGEIKWPPR